MFEKKLIQEEIEQTGSVLQMAFTRSEETTQTMSVLHYMIGKQGKLHFELTG